MIDEASTWSTAILGWLEQSVWLHQFCIIFVLVLLCWWPARLMARRWIPLREDMGPEHRVPRGIARAIVWPLVALGGSAAVLRVGQRMQPDWFGDEGRVLAVLGIFLAYRVLDALVSGLSPGNARVQHLRRALILVLFAVVALHQLGWLGRLLEWMQEPLFGENTTSITAFSITFSGLALFGMLALARSTRSWLGDRMLPRMGVERTLAEALAAVVRYVLIVAGFFWALDLLGFDLSTLGFALGALGVGVGMGLQGMVNNFVSGLILMFEGSIKRGDVLTVGGTDGRVKRIGLRASVIRSREGEDLILPNSRFTDDTITNYSFGDDLQLIGVEVGVSYDADPEEVRDILAAVAEANESVLDRPKPKVMFRSFGESSLDFELRCWIRDAWQAPQVRSDLHFAIWYALKEKGVEIPFPQRDLHVRSGGIEVQLSSGEASAD